MEDFENLLASGKTAVERFVRAHIGSRADAEDILQETYMAAFQGFAALKNRDVFLPWVLGIARRKCADWYRAQARRKEVLMDQLPEQAGETPEESAVEETLDALPERDRMMLRLFYQEMLSQKQISSRLRIPEGTVKSRMNAARSRFRAAYPYPPKGEIVMIQKNELNLPEILPEYSIVWKDEPAFPVDCEELTGWFIVPRAGEKIRWGIYDLPSRKLDVSYDMAVTGPASVHGLEGMAISAKVIQPKTPADGNDPVGDAVEASGGNKEEWTFIGQIKDGYSRFLSAEHLEDGVRTLSTFLDGEEFMGNWGYGEENCGMPVHREPQGLIRRNGQAVTAPEEGFPVDIAGRCELTLDGTVYDTVCLMDLGEYNEGVVSEQYLDRDGRTVLWRRFNRDDWALDRYGKKWSEILPDNEQITINGVKYVHWYDCLCIR